MKKLTLHLPDKLFDHLTTMPTFMNTDKKNFPEMLLSKELIAEREVLGKLEELYAKYDDECAEEMADACEERMNEIKEMAIQHCKDNGIELVAVGNETKKDRLKVPIKLPEED